MIPCLVLVASYVLGAIPWGYLIYRQKTGRDIRGEGSGNIGATNVLRLAGKAAGAVTLALDVGKGYLAVMLAVWFAPGEPDFRAYAAVAVLVGHMYPVFLGFKGGKGVAAALGSFGALAPHAVMVTLVVFIVIVLIWRYVSLAACAAALVFPAAAWWINHPPIIQTVCASASVALILFKHRANLQRIVAGTESKLGSPKA